MRHYFDTTDYYNNSRLYSKLIKCSAQSHDLSIHHWVECLYEVGILLGVPQTLRKGARDGESQLLTDCLREASKEWVNV